MAKKSDKVRLVVVLALIFLSGVAFYFKASSFYSAIKYKIGSRCEGCTPAVSPVFKFDPRIKEFGLEIKKIKVLVPVVKDVNGKNKDEYNRLLQGGVAHYQGTALPGEGKNIFIFGHSSSDVVPGELGKIFAKINDLEKGDEIKIYFKDKEYFYEIEAKDIVEATDMSVLESGDREIITLMTCWPLGTRDKRLIVKAARRM